MRGEIVIAGAGLAGLSAARALRALGFDGSLVMVGAEPHEPYDRPPLSKDFLGGTLPREALALQAPQDAALGLDLRLGIQVVGLDPATRTVRLATGEVAGGAGVVIATGARARALPGPPLLGVHTLRTLDDALALRADLQAGARLVVVGAGFIGAEVASTARALGADVTVVEAAPVPLAGILGERMGAVCGGFHADHGVRLVTGVPVAALTGDGDGTSPPDRVRGVLLADGRELPADAVVVGVGSEPEVGWLAGSGLTVAGGVLTDAAGGTGVPGVVATGDCARRPERWAGGAVVRQEHWTSAQQHPALAAATLLGCEPPPMPPAATVPYFWSDQYGLRLQFAGHRLPGDEPGIVEGEPGAGPFTAVYRRSGEPVAVLAVSNPRSFGRWRRELAAAAPATTA